MIYVVAPKHGRTNPIVYISICSLVGSISVMAIKGFGVAVKLTLSGSNQFTRPATYLFGLAIAGCILVQMNYFNKALDTFSTNVVNPMYFVGFSTATLVASLIMFQGFNTSGARDSLSLLAGLAVTFLGVHLLNLSRAPEPPLPAAHSALESGLMNPRLSISGRMSIDGWGAVPLTPHSANYPNGFGHGRRSSLYRAQSQTLFNAFEHDDELPPSPALHRLEEADDEEDDDEDANERTRLKSPRLSRHNSRSNSPRIGSQDDFQSRRSPQYR
jgi:magnesium transporter